MRASQLCPLLWLCVSLSAVSCLVFDPIAPSIVSVTSSSCATVESNTSRTVVSCTANMAQVVLQLKGTDWNGVLEIPILFLVTPLNVGRYMNCQLDADYGVVTVGHEAWEVSCTLPPLPPLMWYEQQGVMGLQIFDPPFTDPSEIFYGVSTSSPVQSTTRPVIYTILGCSFDCRLSDTITLTGINFATDASVVASSSSGSGRYTLTIVSASSTVIVARLPSTVQASDLDAELLIDVVVGTTRSLNSANLYIDSSRIYPVVLGVMGCLTDDQRRRRTSGCVGELDTVTIQGRGWSSDLTGLTVQLTSPIGNTYSCVEVALMNTAAGSDSFDAACLLPLPSASETYATWQVAMVDDENGVSQPYAGINYAPVPPADESSPLVARIYCTSGCYSGDVLAIEGQQLKGAIVTLLSDGDYTEYDCPSAAQSDTRLTCVLPTVPNTSAGVSVGMRVLVTNAYGSYAGDEGRLTLTTAPPLPRITGIYPAVGSCQAVSSVAITRCRSSNAVWVKSEGWTTDVNDGFAQVVLVTPIGREVACGQIFSNFSTATGVMFVFCILPVVSWQETVLPHSVAIAAPDTSDTWYWTDALTGALQYNLTATPSSATSLPAVYGLQLDCPTVNNVSYCTNEHSVTINGARLTGPVTAVLARTYAVVCDQLVDDTSITCQLPTIKPVDVGLVLEVDIYTSAGRAPTAYPPTLTYAASATYVPSGVPIPLQSSTAGPIRPTLASSSSSSSSSASSPSIARPASSSSSTATKQSPTSSSTTSSSTGLRTSSSSVTRSTTSSPASTAASRTSSSASTARPALTSSSALPLRSSSTLVPVTSALFPTSSGTVVVTGGGSDVRASSSSTGSGNSDSADRSSGGMSGGAVAGIVVLVLVVVLGGVAGACCWMYGCPLWLRGRRSGPRSVDELLNMPDSSIDGEGAGYVPPSYATNAFSSNAAASYQPPNAAASSNTYNPYLPPSMRSSMLPTGRPVSDDGSSGYVPPGGRYVPPNAPRPSIFNNSSTVHGSVDATDGYGHTADDY